MGFRPIALIATVAATISLVLGACSSHDSMSSTVSIPESASFNATDVAFAQGMIPHHAQAIDMADMVDGRTTNPDVVALASEIRAAQGPEIQTMTNWLNSWGQPIPSTDGHGGHDMSGMESMMMSGMMSKADMDRLMKSEGRAFDRMWMEMMILHHEGAVEMARSELATGKDAAVKRLAQAIIDSQTAEIATMNSLLAKLPA